MIGPITPEDALLLFRKLESEDSTVLCVGTLWGWRLRMTGKISASEDGTQVALNLDDKEEGIVLRLDVDDTIFVYSEPGKMPLPQRELVPENARDSACVAVALPLRVPPSMLDRSLEVRRRERLFFIELSEGLQ